MNFLNSDLFGSPFELVETYVYYDEPRTFAMRSISIPDLYYIVNTVDEDEDLGVLIFLAAAVSSQRFMAARSGTIPFRSVFAEALQGTIFKVSQSWESGECFSEITQISAADISSNWLPEENVRLSLPTQTIRGYKEDNIIALSQEQARTVFAIEVEDDSSRITSFPAKASGQLQVAIDGVVTTLARETFGDEVTPTVRDISVSVLDLQAASFVIVLAIDEPGLFESTTVTESVFNDLTSFVQSVGTKDEGNVLGELKKHSARTRNKFRDILKPLAARSSGLKITSVLAGTRTPLIAEATSEAVKFATALIENVTPEITYLSIKRGTLTGLVIRTRRFEIHDAAANKNYKGVMSPEVTEKADGLTVGTNSFVSATIRVETPYINDDSEMKSVKYFLESIQEVDNGDKA